MIELPIPYGRQEITEEDSQAVLEVLKHNYLTGGPRIAAFEDAFAKYVGAKYAVCCSSGTAALHLCTLALQLKPGDKVISSPLTFVASTNCVLYQGGEVDFVDIDPESRLMDLDLLDEKLRKRGRGSYKGIIGVDFAGHPLQMDRLRALADLHGLWIIEDSCHAPGGSYLDTYGNEQRCGNGAYADLAIFSFHPVKHIATGEGGMVTTNDKELYQSMIQYRNHGITRDRKYLTEDHGGWYYEMQGLGYNYRMSDIHAALGLSQLKRAETNLQKRRKIAARYQEELAGLPIKLPVITEGHAFHLYVLEVEERKRFYDYLRQEQIIAQIHYIPVHLQPYYQSLGWKHGDFPIAEAYYQGCISLPLYPSLTENQHSYVIDKVKTFFR